jgi:hypothetical protein
MITQINGKRAIKKVLILLIGIFSVNNIHAQKAEINIHLVHGDSLELKTRAQLLKLLSVYHLNRLIFTNNVNIESGFTIIPHSHPVLTLNTRHIRDDELLLSTFIHEELHWFISYHPRKNEILAELKKTFPNPEVNFPDGSGGVDDTYFHIIICQLEYKALQKLLGELRAFEIFSFWQQDHYKWIYQAVLNHQPILNNLLTKYELVQ